jgi:MFS family permease
MPTARPRRPSLLAYYLTFLSGEAAFTIQGVAVGWHVFSLHHRVLDLGLVGLTLFAPTIAFVLPAGLVTDRFPRRTIMLCTGTAEVTLAVVFLLLVLNGIATLAPYLATLAAIGTARAFAAPAERGLLLSIIPIDRYLRVTATYTAFRELIAIGGPALGGALVAFGTSFALGTSAAVFALALAGVVALRIPPAAQPPATVHLRDALGGMHFIRAHPIILGAITLDLFAVLFGGAVALLPAFADTILRVGPTGLGILRASPAVGSFLTAAYLSRRPPEHRVGRTLLTAVALFGAATIGFALSHDFLFSLAMLALTGCADMISVVIRSGLVQLNVPNDVRGRVTAVENVFIGASNELGAFESGALAALMGTVPSVVAGGALTLLVVGVCALIFPALRRADAMRAPAAGRPSSGSG